MEIVSVWAPGLAGLRGTGLQSEYCAGLCRPWWRGPAERRSCGVLSPVWQALAGVYWQSRDLSGLCRPWRHGGQSRDSAGLGDTVQWNRAPARLCWPWGCGLAQWKLCVFVSPAQLALGRGPAEQRSCRAVQDLGAWLAKQRLCRAGGHSPAKWSSCWAVQAWEGGGLVEIINVCGSLDTDHPMEILLFWGAGLWSSTALAGQRSMVARSEIPQCMEQQLCKPMGRG
jgi:hypothetical protein